MKNFLQEPILRTLICSQCKKYLSVYPIKVYHNYQKKCGRCCKVSDGGVESHLYNILTKDALFPCMNSYDGCSDMLSMETMAEHEHHCDMDQYICYLCSYFVGPAYMLNFHCKNDHPGQTLKNLQVLIDLDQGSQYICYFYSNERKLFFICGSFDAGSMEITMNLIFFGKYFRGDMKYSIRLFSIEGALIYQSKRYQCTVMHQKITESIKCNIDQTGLPKHLVLCTLDLHEAPILKYVENPSIIDPSTGYYLMKCPFYGLTNSSILNTDQEQYDFPAVYYFKGITWRVNVIRKRCLTDLKIKFRLNLQWDNTIPDSDPIEHCNVSVVFRIISDAVSKTITKTVENRNISIGEKCSVSLDDWNVIMNANLGFLRGGVINVEVLLKIHSCHKREVKCQDCKRPCIYC